MFRVILINRRGGNRKMLNDQGAFNKLLEAFCVLHPLYVTSL